MHWLKCKMSYKYPASVTPMSSTGDVLIMIIQHHQSLTIYNHKAGQFSNQATRKCPTSPSTHRLTCIKPKFIYMRDFIHWNLNFRDLFLDQNSPHLLQPHLISSDQIQITSIISMLIAAQADDYLWETLVCRLVFLNGRFRSHPWGSLSPDEAAPDQMWRSNMLASGCRGSRK